MIAIWALLFFVLYYVSIYFDDFGNVTLTYLDGYVPEGVSGTDWSFSQLIEWEVLIYNNFGGRVIYSVFLCLLLKVSPILYNFFTSLMLTITIYFFYKTISLFVKSKISLLVPFFILALYYCITMPYKHDGIYWDSASVLYVWPLAPLSVLIYLVFRFFNKENNKIITILILTIAPLMSLFTSISQEQFGGTVATIILVAFLFNFKTHRQDRNFYILMASSFTLALAGFLFVFLAPGTQAKMGLAVYEEFFSLSLGEKILTNVPKIASDSNFRNYIIGRIFDVYVIGINIHFLLKEKNIFKFIINVVIIALVIVINLLYSYKTIPFVFCLLLLGAQIYTILSYHLPKKDYLIIALVAGMYASCYCLVLSPVCEVRTIIPYIFMLILFLTLIVFRIMESVYKELKFTESSKRKKVLTGISAFFIAGFVLISSVGIEKMITEHIGYKENYACDQLNFATIRRADKEGKNEVYCFKNNNQYRNIQPYDEDYYTDWLNGWIKTYLNVNKDLEIHWINDYGYRHLDLYPATDDMNTTSRIHGLYDYDTSIDARWTAKEFAFTFKPLTRMHFYYPFNFENDMVVLVNGYHYANIHIDGEGFIDVGFENYTFESENNHFIFLLSRAQEPGQVDKRELGILFLSTENV